MEGKREEHHVLSGEGELYRRKKKGVTNTEMLQILGLRIRRLFVSLLSSFNRVIVYRIDC